MYMIDSRRPEIKSDLGLDFNATKGQLVYVNNCWHFYSAGDSVEVMFHNKDDFRAGMNRIHVVAENCNILILAFVLMDTHFHFILYGDFDLCNRFVHEYVRRTSIYLSKRYSTRKTLKDIKVSHQRIEDDRYLKTAICYVIKNPYNAGLPFNAWDYPWSSGPLYFRHPDFWTTPRWMLGPDDLLISRRSKKRQLLSHDVINKDVSMIDGLIDPKSYVSVDIVEKVFRTHRAYNYFLFISKDSDVEERDGIVSHLTIPIAELREIRKKVSTELFGSDNLRNLDVGQRIRLAKVLKSRFNSSVKQIAKACGLIYEEVKSLL